MIRVENLSKSFRTEEVEYGNIVAFKYELLSSWWRIWWQLSGEFISYTR